MIFYLKKYCKLFIPKRILSWIYKQRQCYEYIKICKHYLIVLKRIRKRINKHEKVQVCFFVTYASSFAAGSVLELMMNDPVFNPFILIIPDMYRGDDNMYFQMEKSYNDISKMYPSVKIYRSFDEELNEFIDYRDKIDIVFPSCPYDILMYQYYRMSYLITKKLLTFFINYGYSGYLNFSINVVKSIEYTRFWRVALESYSSKKSLEKYDAGKGKRMIVSGYCKMDSLAKMQVLTRNRKKIIIAPHHTVKEWKGGLNLSQFLRYSDFFLKLPKIYPEIDFVFRPHPLLFITLKENDLWGTENVGKYLDDIKTMPNMLYDDTPEYFNLFANSDALIHDCGSFLAEYFYTVSPQCYMLRDEAAIDEEFLPFGMEMLNHVYKAFFEDDILQFIDNVVINNEDHMKMKREKFAKENVMINYPNASRYVVEYIKGELL